EDARLGGGAIRLTPSGLGGEIVLDLLDHPPEPLQAGRSREPGSRGTQADLGPAPDRRRDPTRRGRDSLKAGGRRATPRRHDRPGRTVRRWLRPPVAPRRGP